ncbi:MAG: glycosyltransferase family 4 protein, partial [Eudoraea sp.]|nr:glycosyltransferase family 4 protein [Eudoraea sp.]
SLEDKWKSIIEKTQPSLVHIHGTEFAHGLALMRACPELKFLVSIQGILNQCAKYYTADIPIKDIRKSKSFRDYVRNDGILEAKNKFLLRANTIENEYLRLANHIVHRSNWDGDYSRELNKDAIYYICNDSLRDSFYSSTKWSLETKVPHTIFLSQAGYPLKGLHKVLEAIPKLIKDFPNLKIRVAGENIIQVNSIKDRLRISGYGKYLRKLIRKYRIENHIEFTGTLNEKEMVSEYLNSHLAISASSIDNVPNSILEAQYLGTPVVASEVGGVPEIIEHGKTGLLYSFDDTDKLAKNIRDIFSNDQLAKTLSKNEIILATKRQDKDTNLQRVLEVYNNVITGE